MRSSRPLLAILVSPLLLATVVGLIILWPDDVRPELNEELGVPQDLVDAEVVRVEEASCSGTPAEADLRCVTPTVRLTEGPDDGDEVTLFEEPAGVTGSLDLEVGDAVVLAYEPGAEPEFRYSLADRERRRPLAVLAFIFAAAVLAVARWRGLRALIGTAASLGVVVGFILPAILDGSSPLAVSLVGAGAIAVLTIYLTHGVSRQSTSALLGTLLSLALVGLLAVLFVDLARFSGLASEESSFLTISAGQVNLEGLLLGGIIIGALGVLDDVTVTQVSAVWELRAANPSLRRRDLYRSAISIGRDHIASAVNTLVLAYVGASLPLLLLFVQADQALADVVNGEVVAVEVVRTLCGSIGLIASVPLTTALAAVIALPSPASGATPEPTPTPDPTPDPDVDDPRRHRGRSESRFWAADRDAGPSK